MTLHGGVTIIDISLMRYLMKSGGGTGPVKPGNLAERFPAGCEGANSYSSSELKDEVDGTLASSL